jgi:glycosyltransferase involved in cell wall biosynthesis
MKVLFLTAHLPFPPISGGRRREFELITRLGREHDLHLCSITKSWQTDSQYMHELSSYCASVDLFEASYADGQDYPRYSNQMRKHISDRATFRISDMLRKEKFDVVHVEGYYLMQHVPSSIDVPVILVEHNIECLLNLQRFKLASKREEKIYYWQEYTSTLGWEKVFWKRATLCVTLTDQDKISMSRLEPGLHIKTIPNGTDHNETINNVVLVSDGTSRHPVDAEHPSVLFVGNFAYEPNVDAALHFSKTIFPLILRDVPNARLYLVGNSPPQEIIALKLNKQIEVTGFVNSLTCYYRAADIVICPLRIGGGIKVKILEALNAGKAIVSTSVGAQGLDLRVYRALAIADEPVDFAKKVVQLLRDPNQRHRQEEEARAYSKTLRSWEQVSNEFSNCYREMSFSRKKRLDRKEASTEFP